MVVINVAKPSDSDLKKKEYQKLDTGQNLEEDLKVKTKVPVVAEPLGLFY